ncbi:MAG: hypothetical protein R3251_02300 [Candidatus Spechtbacterales bacterium]|nr:hypothetical protein [Candidatus Spechtbacterales bacterium]
MSDFLNRNWFFPSMVAGIIFLAFSAMIQSWLLAITTLIFMLVQFFIAKITQQKQVQDAERSIQEFQEGRFSADQPSSVRVKIPPAFILLLVFIVIAFIELAIIVFSGY